VFEHFSFPTDSVFSPPTPRKIIPFGKLLKNWAAVISAKKHKRQRRKRQSVTAKTRTVGGYSIAPKAQAPTPQAPVRNRQTRKVANAKVRIG